MDYSQRPSLLTPEEYAALIDEPVSPERQKRADRFEKELFALDYKVPKSIDYHLEVKCEKILTNREADQILIESGCPQTDILNTIVGDLSLRKQNQSLVEEQAPRLQKYLDDLFEGIVGDEE